MTYYIHDFYSNQFTEFQDWWSLIQWFYRRPNSLNSLAHNYHDTIVVYHYNHNNDVLKRTVYSRNIIAYDSFDRVVSIDDIRQGVQQYDPKLEKPRKRKFYSRRKQAWGWRSNIRRNKNYCAKLVEYRDLFPCDDAFRDADWLVKTWWDDFHRRGIHKSWKSQTKYKKQWMKNLSTR